MVQQSCKCDSHLLIMQDNYIIMLTTVVSCCGRSLVFAAVSHVDYNLKHMRIFDLLSVWVLRFPRVYVHRVMHTYTSAHTHTHRHVVLIIGPISNETHPFPICCPPPVKIFLLIYNNSLQTFLQPHSDWKGKSLLSEPLPSLTFTQQGGLLGTETVR